MINSQHFIDEIKTILHKNETMPVEVTKKKIKKLRTKKALLSKDKKVEDITKPIKEKLIKPKKEKKITLEEFWDETEKDPVKFTHLKKSTLD